MSASAFTIAANNAADCGPVANNAGPLLIDDRDLRDEQVTRTIAGLDQAGIRALVDYCPDTGRFVWRTRPASMFENNGRGTPEGKCAGWNGRYAGREAFARINDKGYFCGAINGYQHVLAHRVAWLWWHGEVPGILDHINRNRADNRIANLRPATRWLNARNRGIDLSSVNNPVGIRVHAEGYSYGAHVTWFGRVIELGRFDTIEEAIAARNAGMRLISKIVGTQAGDANRLASPGSVRPFVHA